MPNYRLHTALISQSDCPVLAYTSRIKMRQVYLLTPMDRATLLHAKSTISLEIYHRVQLPRNERRSIANCYQDREMSVISTYLNDNAQIPLGRFVVDILYNQVCNKYTDKSNLGLKPCIASARGHPRSSETSPFDRAHTTFIGL